MADPVPAGVVEGGLVVDECVVDATATAERDGEVDALRGDVRTAPVDVEVEATEQLLIVTVTCTGADLACDRTVNITVVASCGRTSVVNANVVT